MKHTSKWILEKLYPEIFHLQFNNRYDTAMHFLRYQEFYESPIWKGVNFTILEYMEWYAKTQCKLEKNDLSKYILFSYPEDWRGFNIPSEVFSNLTLKSLYDPNKYDQFMNNIVSLIIANINTEEYPKFYLIGTTKGMPHIIDHEVAHGLYYTKKIYREKANSLFDFISPPKKLHIKNWLKNKGYHNAVIIDEAIAFLATGLPEKLDIDLKSEQEPFIDLFEKTIKEISF